MLLYESNILLLLLLYIQWGSTAPCHISHFKYLQSLSLHSFSLSTIAVFLHVCITPSIQKKLGLPLRRHICPHSSSSHVHTKLSCLNCFHCCLYSICTPLNSLALLRKSISTISNIWSIFANIQRHMSLSAPRPLY